ncbi:hypothetical protein [Desulfosporosinus sp. Sb-LF]|nr:hypothetical protein [Desulfosporosinus sp. Sb-LF]
MKVAILNEKEKLLAQKEVNIFHEGFYTVHASPDVVIGVRNDTPY